MEIGNLLKMANRIGDFFEAMPEPDEAHDGIANHIQTFRESRMRVELLAHIERTGDEGLYSMALQAMGSHLDALKPALAAWPHR